MQGVVIAGTHSGCGKTTITLGILAALRKKGLNVQPFKAGPDFIDTGLHTLITGRTSRNLDLWMCGTEYVRECFYRNSEDADISVVEGVMGMYDGTFSTADLAASLGVPVVLVIDAYGMAESAGAVVKGFLEYGHTYPNRSGMARQAPALAGVIMNRVASERHYKRLRDSIRDIPVLGYLPRDLNFQIPHRHLGLVGAEEQPIDPEGIDTLADAVLEYIDVDRIVQECKSAKVQNATSGLPSFRASELKIAVASDRAFCFYYEDNLDLLRNLGAEIVRFSPLADPSIPPGTDALYIGGGYPELYARQLSNNRSMIDSVKSYSLHGGPVYGECGGFMYLTEGIFDFDGEFHSMTGIFPVKTRMRRMRTMLGYREVQCRRDSIIGRGGSSLRGHEFHYSELVARTEAGKRGSGEVHEHGLAQTYAVKDGEGNYICNEGYLVRNTLGSYIHIHFGSSPAAAGNFVEYALKCKSERLKV